MENNKQDNPIDWLSNQFYKLFEQYSEGDFDRSTFNELMLYDTYTARKMYQEKIEQAELDAKEIVIIKECAEQSTSEASKYAEGYKEGYNRAIELTKWTISNLIPPHNEQR
jgi:hypothetical protein